MADMMWRLIDPDRQTPSNLGINDACICYTFNFSISHWWSSKGAVSTTH